MKRTAAVRPRADIDHRTRAVSFTPPISRFERARCISRGERVRLHFWRAPTLSGRVRRVSRVGLHIEVERTWADFNSIVRQERAERAADEHAGQPAYRGRYAHLELLEATKDRDELARRLGIGRTRQEVAVLWHTISKITILGKVRTAADNPRTERHAL